MLQQVDSTDVNYKRIMISGYDKRAELLSLAIFGSSKDFDKISGIRVYRQMIGEGLLKMAFGFDEKTHKIPELAYVFETIMDGVVHKLQILLSKTGVQSVLTIGGFIEEIKNKVEVEQKFKNLIR